MFKAFLGSAALVGFALISFAPSSVHAASVMHKCTNPATSMKLQDVIDNASEGDEIKVMGDCAGFSYVITTDGLTLRGQGNATITGDGVAAALTIVGAHNVAVENFALIDGGLANGIVVRETGSALLLDIDLITGADGLVVVHGAFVEFDSSNVVGATDDGIVAFQNATIVIRDADISGNFDDGVVVSRSSVVQINGVTTINNNGGRGVTLSGGRVQFRGDNTVQDNGQEDLGCFGFSRFIVNNAITSSTKNIIARNCEVAELSGSSLFVDPVPLLSGLPDFHPFNLVDCTPPGTVNDDSISEALANGLTFILVRGLCDEQVDITIPNITIQGENLDGDGKPVDGIESTDPSSQAVNVRGAQNIFLINLKIISALTGVTAFTGAQMIIINSVITPGTGNGMILSHNAHATLLGSHVTKNGIHAWHNSSLLLRNTIVTGDAGTGRPSIDLNFGSVVEMSGSTLNRAMLLQSAQVRVDGVNVIDSPDPQINCSKFSTIILGAPGGLTDGSDVALIDHPDDILITPLAVGVPSCVLTGF